MNTFDPNTHIKTVTIVGVGGTAAQVARFSIKVDYEYKRPWYKRRYGYYEKSSKLRHKRKCNQLANRNRLSSLKLYISLDAQFDKNGPNNAIGR